MAKEDEIHKKKVIALEKSENRLAIKVKAAENKLLQQIIDKFVDKLDLDNGRVLSNGKNITLTSAIDSIINEFNATVNTYLMKGYVADVNKNTETNRNFFNRFEESNDINYKKASEEIKKKTLERLGIATNGKLKKGGFIDGFTNDSRLSLELKELVTKAITTGASITDMKAQLKMFVAGDGNKVGKLTANYNTFVFDTFTQIDRLETGLYAEALGLSAFRYVGGLIKTSRFFCCQRNNLVFTIEEAKKWSSLTFQGKSTPYDPLIDLGGYRCRHTKQFISNRRAASIRDDLILDEKGRLIKKPGGVKQLLNICK